MCPLHTWCFCLYNATIRCHLLSAWGGTDSCNAVAVVATADKCTLSSACWWEGADCIVFVLLFLLSFPVLCVCCSVVSRMETPDHWITYAHVVGGEVMNSDARTAVHRRKVANYY